MCNLNICHSYLYTETAFQKETSPNKPYSLILEGGLQIIIRTTSPQTPNQKRNFATCHCFAVFNRKYLAPALLCVQLRCIRQNPDILNCVNLITFLIEEMACLWAVSVFLHAPLPPPPTITTTT